MQLSGFRVVIMAAVGLASFAAVVGGIRVLASGPARHIDPIKEFSIRFPSGWEFREAGPDGASVLGWRSLGASESSPRAAVNVTVESLDQPLDAPAFCRLGGKMQSGLLPEFQQIEEGSSRIGDVEAPWIRYTYVAGPQKRRFQAWQFFLVRRSRGYVITCTSDPATFERFRPDFEEIALSFRFE
jgi:hypothetical protein